MVFVNVIFLIQFTLFSATFYVRNLIKNERRWGCFYTVTIDLNKNECTM